jgi:hypothetical protein
MDKFWTHGVKTYSLIPFPVRTYSSASEVEGIPSSVKISLNKKIHREVSRTLSDIARLFTYFVRK